MMMMMMMIIIIIIIIIIVIIITVLQTEVDVDTGEPYDTLTPLAVDWCRSVDSNATKVTDIVDNNDEKVSV